MEARSSPSDGRAERRDKRTKSVASAAPSSRTPQGPSNGFCTVATTRSSDDKDVSCVVDEVLSCQYLVFRVPASRIRSASSTSVPGERVHSRVVHHAVAHRPCAGDGRIFHGKSRLLLCLLASSVRSSRDRACVRPSSHRATRRRDAHHRHRLEREKTLLSSSISLSAPHLHPHPHPHSHPPHRFARPHPFPQTPPRWGVSVTCGCGCVWL